jgi:hypothetical protein
MWQALTYVRKRPDGFVAIGDASALLIVTGASRAPVALGGELLSLVVSSHRLEADGAGPVRGEKWF